MVDETSQAAPAPPSDGLWLSFSEIAALKRVSKQAVGKRAGKLIAAGVLQTRPGKGKAVLINLAQFDTAIGDIGDAAKEAGAETVRSGSAREPQQPRFRDAQTREKEYAADLKWLELERLRGNLISIADFDENAERFAMAIVEVVEELVKVEDELMDAVTMGGHSLRAALRRIARNMRIQIVAAMKTFAADLHSRASDQSSTGIQPATAASGDGE